jgi:hypothetical protein
LPPLLDALQAPFQKINLQRLLTDLPFRLRHPVRVQPSLAAAGKRRCRRFAAISAAALL